MSDTTETTTTRATTTQATETTTEQTARTTATDDTTTEAVVVENRTDAEQLVDAEVRQDGSRLVGGRFRVPANVGVRFEWERYVVGGRLADGEWRTLDWSPRSYSSSPHSDGNRNAGVVVSDDGVEVVQNVCDYLKPGSVHVEEYRPASGHRVETTTSE